MVSVSVVALPTNVSVAAGRVSVTSAVDAGPINVTAFVPLSVSSLNNILPAALEDPDNTGAVNILLVSVWEPVRVVTVLSIVRVTAPEVPPPDNPVPAVTAVMSAPASKAVLIADIAYLLVLPSAALTPNKLSVSVILVSSEYESILGIVYLFCIVLNFSAPREPK